MVGLLETPVEPAGPTVVDAKGAMKRIKRLERPSKAALDEDVNKVVEEIETLQTLTQDIKATMDGRQQSKQAMYGELQQAKSGMSELTAAFRSVQDEKRALRDELEHADKMRERMRADARSLRDKLPYVRVEQIDEEIKKLEYRMTHTSLTLQEEKKFLQQVKELTKSRDFVRDYNDRLEQINQDESSRADLLEKIREKDAILNDVRAQQDQQRKLVAEIRDKEASQAADIPALAEKKNAAFEKIKVLRDEIKELRANFRSREDEYRDRERLWKDQQQIQRRKDYEKRDAERKEREKIRKQRELENFVEPFTNEIIMVDQLTSYLQKYVPAVEESVSTPQKAEIVAPKGVGNVLVSKKNKFDEETDSWFSGKGKGKKAKAPAAPKDKSKEKISMSLDALTSFQTVKLSPPTTVGDVLKSIEELKVKKEEFERLQKGARERRERGEEDVPISKRELKLADADGTEEEGALVQSALEEDNQEEGQKVLVELETNDTHVKGDCEGRQNHEGLSVNLPDGLDTKLPEDLEETQLPEDLSTNLLEDLEAKLPEDLEAKLPADLETKLPEDLETKLPEDLESKLPEDLETKLPEDLETKLPEDLETKLPEDLETKLPEDLESKLPDDLVTKLPEDLDPKLHEDLEGKLPRAVEAKLPENLEGEVGVDGELNENL